MDEDDRDFIRLAATSCVRTIPGSAGESQDRARRGHVHRRFTTASSATTKCRSIILAATASGAGLAQWSTPARALEQPDDSRAVGATRTRLSPLMSCSTLLGDANQTVRTLATHELVDRIGSAAVVPLKTLFAVTRRVAVSTRSWPVGARAAGRHEPAEIEALAHDQDAMVRVHAMKLLAERGGDDVPLARAALADADLFVSLRGGRCAGPASADRERQTAVGDLGGDVA